MDDLIDFVEKVNPAANLTYHLGYTGDFIRYSVGDVYNSIESEVDNIMYGLVNNDFSRLKKHLVYLSEM